MKIEIEYNGTYAICKVDGKYFHERDSLTKAQVLNAFRTIEQQYRRDTANVVNKSNKNK